MIYCVWYPSGGFGHFVNAVLTLYGNNFVRPKGALEFSSNGNSHSLDLVTPKYIHECWPGGIEFDQSKNYSVLIDNGIDNESKQFKLVLPQAEVVKICYTDYSWPIVARTAIDKAMNSSIDRELTTDAWDIDDDWARREKYFLYLRDHKFRFQWKDDTWGEYAINIEQICDYRQLYKALDQIVHMGHFKSTWEKWRDANDVYISPVEISKKIITKVKNKQPHDLTHITDLWTQAVLYYFIYLEFHIEVPHNDYSNWFTNTTDIVKMLEDNGVNVDSF
jgi:hypothetical protein